MVRLPVKAPHWKDVIQNRPTHLLALSQSSEVHQFVNRANENYLYWDDFAALPPIDGIAKEELWAYIRFLREGQMYPLPFKSKNDIFFTLWVPNSLQRNLHIIDLFSFESMISNDQITGKKGLAKFIIKAMCDESIASCQIAGAHLSHHETLEMLLAQKKPKNREEKMVESYYKTLQSIKEMVHEEFNLELLKKINQMLTEGTLDDPKDEGRFRTPSDISRLKSPAGEMVFLPPPTVAREYLIDNLIQFVNNQTKSPFYHPFVKAQIIHFWFNYYHPFVKGNGRTARILVYWHLLNQGYHLFDFLALSAGIQKTPGKYLRAFLDAEIDDGDLTYFVYFNSTNCVNAIESMKYYIIEEQVKSRNAASEITTFPELNVRQARIIHHAISHPNEILTISKHQNSQGISYQTARTDLIELENKGLLKKVQKGKSTYYIPAVDLGFKIRSSSKR